MARGGTPYTALDRLIGVFSPQRALERLSARMAIERKRGYDAAEKGRGTDGWRAGGTSADAEIASAGGTLRFRSRDLVRNNPLAAMAVQVLVNNIAGDGIVPRAKCKDPALAIRINEEWARWSRTCDRHGHTDFSGLISLAVREMIEGGDCFAVARPMRRRAGRISLQIELREADHLDAARVDNFREGGRIDQGIEYDAQGRRTAYWMFDDHPGGTSAVFARRFESRRIPAERVAHLFERQRVQSRGVPWGVAAMRHMRDFDDWHRAELVRKKTEACLVGVVVGADEGDQGVTPEILDSDGTRIESFEPGMIAYARGAKDVEFNQPSSAGGVGEWSRVQLHQVAAGWRVPYALLTGDLSQANFSSSRVGLNEFRRMVSTLQWLTVIPQFCQPIWDWFIEYGRLEGLWPMDAVIDVDWQPPRFESVNPKQDVEADIAEVRAGFATLGQKIAARGYSPDSILEEHAALAAKLDEAGLVFDSDPRRVTKGGLIQQDDAAGNGPPDGPASQE